MNERKKMTGVFRKSVVKAVCMALVVACTVISVACIQKLMIMTEKGMIDPTVVFERMEREPEKTSYFADRVNTAANTVVEYYLAKKCLEKDGALNLNQKVDIRKFYDMDYEQSELRKKLTYTYKDLWDASRSYESSGASQSIDVLQMGTNYVYLTEKTFQELERLGANYNDDGKFVIPVSAMIRLDDEDETKEKEALEACMSLSDELVFDDCWEINTPAVSIQPKEGNWLALFNTDNKLNGYMSQYGEALERGLDDIHTKYLIYQQGNSYADYKSTNFGYYIYNKKTDEYFTNIPKDIIPDPELPEKTLKYMKEELPNSVVFDGYTLESDLKWDSGDFVVFSDYTKGKNYKDNWEYGFFVDTVPTTHADDEFCEYINGYASARASIGQIRLMFLIAMLILVLAIIFLTIGAGRKENQDDEVALTKFDHIKSEIAAVLVVTIWAIIWSFGVLGIAETETLRENYIFVAVMIALPTAVCFLIGYLSLVRRVKAHTLWSNSLSSYVVRVGKKIFYIFKDLIQDVWRTWDLINRVVVGVIFTILANILAVIFIADSHAAILPFFVIVFDLFLAVYVIRYAIEKQKLMDGLKRMKEGVLGNKIDTSKMKGSLKEEADLINGIDVGLQEAVMERVKSERMKTELITNVSHDLKTPLTSIINYVDLLKRETEDFEKATPLVVKNYIDVLEAKANRLKQLTEDVVEASKITSGNIHFDNVTLDLVELLNQVEAEYEEKLIVNGLKLIRDFDDSPIPIYADGRKVWRVFGNLYGNLAKYALPDSRVYVSLKRLAIVDATGDLGTNTLGTKFSETKISGTEANVSPKYDHVVFTMKNISAAALNIAPEELAERFVRGEKSRTTEGSGLGLSIAKNLTEAMGGKFEIQIDGDLFKVIIEF